MRFADIGIRAVGGSTVRCGSDAPPWGSPVDTALALTEAAARDALGRAGLTPAELGEPHLVVCDVRDPWDDEPPPPVGRRVLDRLGAGRAHAHPPSPGADDALPLLGELAGRLREDRTGRRGILLAPAQPYSPLADHDRRHRGGTAAAVLAERGWPHNRLRSIVTRDVAPRADPAYTRPPTAPPSAAPQPARRMPTALLERPAWLESHAGHHRDLKDRPLTLVCSLVGKALREARTPWETIDHIVLHTAANDMSERFRRHFRLRRHRITDIGPESGRLASAALLIALKHVLDADPEPGTRVLLTSLAVHGTWSAAVLEV
ncbi:3-oxoacyl-[acyl-carrier-protein] synthase III C-terminal domain-containing protein [Embleya sp. AB8]|uniref:3-oxoacyl-[acyl-carrier-protein] synthase III C-terminal domain-containing protein n=1 Tax=Embleya sp. AB8 TaxID=3156304 RepID=UPI003C74B3A3